MKWDCVSREKEGKTAIQTLFLAAASLGHGLGCKASPCHAAACIGHHAGSVVKDWPPFGVHGAFLEGQEGQ
jgi:hypothetical protein